MFLGHIVCTPPPPPVSAKEFTKNRYRGGGLPKKGALMVCRLKGGRDLARKRGGGLGVAVDTPMHTMGHFVEPKICVTVYFK